MSKSLARQSSFLLLAGLVSLAALGCGSEQVTDATGTVTIAKPGEIKAHVESLAGNVVLVNIWATWCGPCVSEFPALVSIAEDFRNRGVRVVAVSVDLPNTLESTVEPFVRRHRAPFDVFISDWEDPTELLRVFDKGLTGAIPATLVYDREGVLRAIVEGGQTLDEFVALLTPYL